MCTPAAYTTQSLMLTALGLTTGVDPAWARQKLLVLLLAARALVGAAQPDRCAQVAADHLDMRDRELFSDLSAQPAAVRALYTSVRACARRDDKRDLTCGCMCTPARHTGGAPCRIAPRPRGRRRHAVEPGAVRRSPSSTVRATS